MNIILSIGWLLLFYSGQLRIRTSTGYSGSNNNEDDDDDDDDNDNYCLRPHVAEGNTFLVDFFFQMREGLK